MELLIDEIYNELMGMVVVVVVVVVVVDSSLRLRSYRCYTRVSRIYSWVGEGSFLCIPIPCYIRLTILYCKDGTLLISSLIVPHYRNQGRTNTLPLDKEDTPSINALNSDR